MIKKIKTITLLLMLSTSAFAGADVGNSTDTKDGQTYSIAVNPCPESQDLSTLHTELLKREGYNLAFNRLEDLYYPLYEKAMEQIPKNIVCMTNSDLGINPFNNRPRSMKWEEDGAGFKMNQLNISKERFYSSKKSDLERGVLIIKEMLHNEVNDLFKSKRFKLSHRLTYNMYHAIKKPITLEARSSFIKFLKNYETRNTSGLYNFHRDTLAICNYSYEQCVNLYEASSRIDPRSGYKVLVRAINNKNMDIRNSKLLHFALSKISDGLKSGQFSRDELKLGYYYPDDMGYRSGDNYKYPLDDVIEAHRTFKFYELDDELIKQLFYYTVRGYFVHSLNVSKKALRAYIKEPTPSNKNTVEKIFKYKLINETSELTEFVETIKTFRELNLFLSLYKEYIKKDYNFDTSLSIEERSEFFKYLFKYDTLNDFISFITYSPYNKEVITDYSLISKIIKSEYYMKHEFNEIDLKVRAKLAYMKNNNLIPKKVLKNRKLNRKLGKILTK